jgi:glucose/arabinose dehydrogenase
VLLSRLAGSLVVVGTILNSATAATLPGGFAETLVANGLSNPTAMEFAPDGRLFVSQQSGQLRVIKNGSLLVTPFLTVTVNSLGERGLLGIAFDPDFASNHYVYAYYTATTPTIHNRVSRFTASGDVVLAGSEVVILDLNDLSGASNHNGGGLHFGSDGKLYISVGENANSANSQTLANLLGKILRLHPDG